MFLIRSVKYFHIMEYRVFTYLDKSVWNKTGQSLRDIIEWKNKLKNKNNNIFIMVNKRGLDINMHNVYVIYMKMHTKNN